MRPTASEQEPACYQRPGEHQSAMQAAAVGAGAAALAMQRAGFSKAQMLEMMPSAWEIMKPK